MPVTSFKRTPQVNDSTCGPTVLQMLLDAYGIKLTQDQIIDAGHIRDTLEPNGTRIDQLALALTSLAPGYTLWYKEDSQISDLMTLIHHYHLPVAIDWQGLFWDSLLEEARLSSNLFHGHYSIVTDIDVEKDIITIVDPYYEFIDQDRVFPIDWFKTRWWDVADTEGSEIKEEITYYTSRMIFILIPQNKTFPKHLGLQRVTSDFFQVKVEKARLSLSYHPAFEPKKLSKYFLTQLSVKIGRMLSKLG